MRFTFVEHIDCLDLEDFAIDPHPCKAILAQPFEKLFVPAFSGINQRGQDDDAVTGRQGQNPVHDLVDRLGTDRITAAMAIGRADASEKQPEIIINFGYGTHRGARIVTGSLLFDGYGRRQPLDQIDRGLLHSFEELTGIGGKGFHIPALPLGVKGVEGQARFARSRKTGDHDKPVAGQIQIDIF